LRRLNQTPGATHDLVGMRTDLLKLLKDHPQLKAVDEDFVRLFSSWFGRGFLVLQTIDWSTSAAILERIIRYEAVHEIKDWDDLRSRSKAVFDYLMHAMRSKYPADPVARFHLGNKGSACQAVNCFEI
jgi:malonyl-CoA decarboxylase